MYNVIIHGATVIEAAFEPISLNEKPKARFNRGRPVIAIKEVKTPSHGAFKGVHKQRQAVRNGR